MDALLMLVQARSIGKCLVTFRALEVVYISVGCSHVSLHMMLEIRYNNLFKLSTFYQLICESFVWDIRRQLAQRGLFQQLQP